MVSVTEENLGESTDHVIFIQYIIEHKALGKQRIYIRQETLPPTTDKVLCRVFERCEAKRRTIRSEMHAPQSQKMGDNLTRKQFCYRELVFLSNVCMCIISTETSQVGPELLKFPK